MERIDALLAVAHEVQKEVAALRAMIRRNTVLAVLVAVLVVGGFALIGDSAVRQACERSNAQAAQTEGAFRTAIASSRNTGRTPEETATLTRFLDDLGRQEDCGGLF